MPTDVTAGVAMPDSGPLHRLIRRTRRLLRGSWVATGLGISLGLALGTLAVFAVVDLFVPLEPINLPLIGVVALDPVLRVVALLLVVVPGGVAFGQGVLRPLLRRMSATQVARRIEAHLPGIHNRLVSAIDLERADPVTRPSPVFLRRLIAEALDRIRYFSPRQVLDMASLRRAALTAGVASCLALGAWVLFAERLPTALARIFMPLADIPPASGVVYQVEPGSGDVLRDEEILFTARLESGNADDLRLELYNNRGARLRYDLKPDRNDPAVFRAVVDGSSLGERFEQGFTYRVFGGRTWSRLRTITLVDRPVIAGVRTQVRYPQYMKIPQPQDTPPQAVAVAGPEGTVADPSYVEVVVTSQKEAATGEIQLLEPATARIAAEKQQERAWFEEKLPTASTPGGTWQWVTTAGRKAHTEPASPGTHGHWFVSDPVGLAVHRGDVLFAHVFLPLANPPETVMLEWHDGDGWEHRAYWGADRIREGKPGTASRFHAGALPEPGKWVRLEVPAGKVGLDGQLVRGLAFKMHGGQAFWGRSGSVQVEEPSLRVVGRFPMEGTSGEWVGRFPLVGSGLFRAELRNRSGHPNKPMKELKYLSLVDQPPYVSLERKTNETVLSKPAALPLSVMAFDDYGLDEVRVLYRASADQDYQTKSLWSAGDKPLRNLALDVQLDEAAKLATGGMLRYLIEARDTRGQTARTGEFVVRVAADGAGVDRQLAEIDRVQDTFRDKLVKLLGEQKKIKEKVDRLNQDNAKLQEKLEKIREEKDAAEVKDPATKVTPEKKGTPLSPEEAKRLAEIQAELAKLGAEEDKNAQMADTLNKELKKNNEDAAKLDLLPKAVLDQMQATQGLFERAVAGALKELGKDLKDGADKKNTPDLKDLKDKTEQVDRSLEGVKDRLDALANARKGLKEDVKKAIAALREQIAKADAKSAAKDLEDLKDFLNRLKNQLKSAREKHDALAENNAENKPESKKGKQEDLDRELEKLLDRAKKLLARGDKDKPEFPDTPENDDRETKVPPREADSDEPLPQKGKGKEKKDKENEKAGKEKSSSKPKEDEEEGKFMPRLGGPKPKLDPRYKDKQRPNKKSPKEKGKEGDEDTDAKDKQTENARDLESAEKSLDSDANTVDKLLDLLNNPGKSGKKGDKGESKDPGEGDSLADQLRSLMQSKSMREAMAMAAAAKASGQKGQQGQKSQDRQRPAPTVRDAGNTDGGEAPGEGGALGKLDPETRSILLKMPPSRYREELIRGLNEQGPEAYRAFIQNYFKQLTEKRGKR